MYRSTSRPRHERLRARVTVAVLAVMAATIATTTPAGASPTGFTVVTTPNPVVKNGRFDSVSCMGGACAAVGSFDGARGYTQPLAETKTATGWTIGSIPLPASATDAYLYGVSCALSSWCLAVGFWMSGNATYWGVGHRPLVESWDGSRWKLEPVPVPLGATSTKLLAVSCVPGSTPNCMAVGNYKTTNGQDTLPFVVHRDASGWSPSSMSVPAGAATSSLAGASCPAINVCFAVGEATNTSTGLTSLVLRRWDGSSWVDQATGAGSSTSSLAAITCVSATACAAVGYGNAGGPDGGGAAALALLWNGTNWSATSVAPPHNGTQAFLNDVACSGASDCDAVGYYMPTSGTVTEQSLAEHWDGSSWRVRATTLPPNTINALLLGVACQAVDVCIAVGYFVPNVGWNGALPQTFVQSLQDGTWSITTALDAGGARETFLNAVACVNPSWCMAVGYSVDAIGRRVTLTELWNGKKWKINGPPTPEVGVLSGISCVTATSCTAVGADWSDPINRKALIKTWNGRAWARAANPDVDALAYSELESVSCAAGLSCVAVGNRDAGGLPGTYALAEKFDGSVWSVVSPASPSNWTDLTGVSCPDASTCVAVGVNSIQAFATRWNGATWSDIEPLQPVAGVGFNSVSCSSSTRCTAVGRASLNPLVERWDGASWTVQSPALPAGNYAASLSTVACATDTQCTAGGFSTNDAGITTTLVDAWDGSAWSVVPSASPPSWRSAWIRGVACSTSCVAVGNGVGVSLALVGPG